MVTKSRLTIGVLVLAALAISFRALIAFAAQSVADTQQKIGLVKQAIAENQQRLHQYQWFETTQLTVNGDAKPPNQSLCSYGPDGKVQKVPMGDSQSQNAQASGRRGRVKEHIVEKKKGEMQDYMQQVKSLLALYVPPSSQRIQQAYQSGNVSLGKTAGAGVAQLIFKNYAQPGDQMALSFDTTAKKVQRLNVQTYMGNPKDTVTLAVQFASLPDGTNYVQQSVLDASAKKLQVTTTNSNYQKLAQ